MLDRQAVVDSTFKTRSFLLPESALVQIRYAAGTNCTVSAKTDDGSVPLGKVSAAVETTEKYRLTGFKSLEIQSKEPMTADVKIRAKQIGEPLDNRPLPERQAGSNILQTIRDTVRREMGVQREAFLDNNTGLRSYELPDDAPDEFEEEIMERVDKAQAKEKAKNERQIDTGPDPASDDAGDGTPLETSIDTASDR